MTDCSVDAADAPAAVAQLVAPPEWRTIDFISDLHLADETPAACEMWSSYMRDSAAEAIFILGDLFEAWPGDDARFEGFERRCAGVLREASASRFVAFMVGNRDFLVGRELLDDCGILRLDDPTVLEVHGLRVLLTHGDAWCLADRDYLRLRAQVRSPAWTGAVLAQSLAARRALARQMRAQSEAQAQGRNMADWADVDPGIAVSWLQANSATVLIHGHTHRPGSDLLAPGLVREVLSDWDLDHGAGTDDRAEVLRWQEGSGFQRLSPMAAARR